MQFLTPDQEEQIRSMKMQGKTIEEVKASLMGGALNVSTGNQFKEMPQPKEQTGFGQQALDTAGEIAVDVPQDIFSNVVGLGEGFNERGRSMRETAAAGLSGEQGIGSSAVQFTGQLAGGFADAGFALIQTALSAPLPQSAETSISESVGVAAQEVDRVTGISQWFNSQSPEVQRNISGTLGIVDFATLGTATTLSRPIGKTIGEAFTRVAKEAEVGNPAPAIRANNAAIDPTARQTAVDNLTESYMSSMVEDRTAINNKLDDLASTRNRFSDVEVTRDSLIADLADEGYIPQIEGRRARFNSSMGDVEARQKELMGEMQNVLAETRATISTDELYNSIKASLRSDPRVGTDINTALTRIDALREGARSKYGDVLSAKQVNELKIEGNQKRGDTGNNPDPVVTDTWANQARASNEWINNNVGDDLFRQTNSEYGRLQTLNDTMKVLRNQQIDVGILGRALGSYVATVAGSTAGVSVGGPGGLVVAGLLANIGADKLAGFLRNRMFNDEVVKVIRDVMRNDDKLRLELQKKATTEAGRNAIKDLMGPVGQTMELPPATPGQTQAQNFVPQQAPQAGVRTAGLPEERTREGAIRQPEGEATSTLTEQAARQDNDAVAQAVSEMEAELSGQTRPSTGENFVQTADGSAYRFNELPSWVPDGLRDANLMERVMINITTNKKPRSNAGLEIELQQVTEARIKTRIAEIKEGQGGLGVFSGDTAFAVALMAGGTYFLAGEDGSILPIVAIGAIMSNPVTRKAAIKNIDKVSEQATKRNVVNNNVEQTKPGFNKSATTQTTLLEEAKKFDSAEDYIKAQVKEVTPAKEVDFVFPKKFTRTDIENTLSELDGGDFTAPSGLFAHRGAIKGTEGNWFSVNAEKADSFAKSATDGVITTVDITGKKFAPISKFGAKVASGKSSSELNSMIKKSIDGGYDGLYSGSNLILPTKAQLTDIWKQANKKTTLLEEAKKFDSIDDIMNDPLFSSPTESVVNNTTLKQPARLKETTGLSSAEDYLEKELDGTFIKTSDSFDADGEFVKGTTAFKTAKGGVSLSFRENPNAIKLIKIIAEGSGTGVGTDVVNALKGYVEVSGKKLVIVKPNDYWKRFDWLTPTNNKDKFGKPLTKVDQDKPLREQVYSIEYDPNQANQ